MSVFSHHSRAAKLGASCRACSSASSIRRNMSLARRRCAGRRPRAWRAYRLLDDRLARFSQNSKAGGVIGVGPDAAGAIEAVRLTVKTAGSWPPVATRLHANGPRDARVQPAEGMGVCADASGWVMETLRLLTREAILSDFSGTRARPDRPAGGECLVWYAVSTERYSKLGASNPCGI